MATTLKKDNKEYIPKQWEEVPCPFCNSTHFKLHERFGPNHRYQYVKCLTCNLVYLNPRPRYDASFINTAYEDYAEESYHVISGGNLDEKEKAQLKQHKFILNQIEKKLKRKGKLLEIGCATGLFLLAAKDLGWEVVGIDISSKMINHVTKVFNLKAFCEQYSSKDLTKEGGFDLIYCSHVIEHIPDPNEWFQKFKKDLKPDGMVCLNVPNQYSLTRVIKRFLKRIGLKKDTWDHWRTPDHLYEPHMSSMKYVINKNDFKIIDCFSYSRKELYRNNILSYFFNTKLKSGSNLRFFIRQTLK